MIPRPVKGGYVVLVDETTAWRELLQMRPPPVSFPQKDPSVVYPGSDALCTVEDLSRRDDESAPPHRE
jgi:hypothetical protein